MLKPVKTETDIREKKQERNQGNDMNADQKSPKQIIVQCPACFAKFALNAATLEGVEFPRFHCSRCDHIFSKEENFLRPTAAAETAGAALDQTASADEEEEGVFIPKEQEAAWTLGRSSNSKGLEIPRSYESNRAISAPHENALAERMSAAGAVNPANQIEFNFAYNPAEAAGGLEDTPWIAPDFSGTQAVKEESFNYREAPKSPAAAALAKLPAQAAWEALHQRRPAAWKGCVILAAPIILFLTLLLGVSYFLKANSPMTEQISEGLFPNAARVAPAGLTITKLKHRSISLEDGESLKVVMGVIENGTDKTFHEIQLEALTFDRGGKRIAGTKVSAASTLAKARIKSLSLEMIKELQSRKPAKRFELKPGEKSEFTIALPDEGTESPAYFSARIYSVKS